MMIFLQSKVRKNKLEKKKKKKVWEKPLTMEERNAIISKLSQDTGWKVGEKETISTYVHSDFIYDTNFFTQSLQNFQALGFLSDGSQIISPEKIQLFPYFKNH